MTPSSFRTCTVGQITRCGRSELVDVVVAATLLDLDRGGPESAAVLLPVAANPAGDDALLSLRMRPRQPQRGVGAAFVHGDTPLRHLKTLTFVEEAVPAFGNQQKRRRIRISIIIKVDAVKQKM